MSVDLFELVSMNRYRQARLVLDAGADPNLRNARYETPLMACLMYIDEQERRAQIMHMLLAFGADVNAQNDKGQTVLMYSCILDLVDCILLLLEQDCINLNISDTGGNTALMYACALGRSPIVYTLLEELRLKPHALDMYATNNADRTAIQIAADHDFTHIVQLFSDIVDDYWKNYNEISRDVGQKHSTEPESAAGLRQVTSPGSSFQEMTGFLEHILKVSDHGENNNNSFRPSLESSQLSGDQLMKDALNPFRDDKLPDAMAHSSIPRQLNSQYSQDEAQLMTKVNNADRVQQCGTREQATRESTTKKKKGFRWKWKSGKEKASNSESTPNSSTRDMDVRSNSIVYEGRNTSLSNRYIGLDPGDIPSGQLLNGIADIAVSFNDFSVRNNSTMDEESLRQPSRQSAGQSRSDNYTPTRAKAWSTPRDPRPSMPPLPRGVTYDPVTRLPPGAECGMRSSKQNVTDNSTVNQIGAAPLLARRGSMRRSKLRAPVT